MLYIGGGNARKLTLELPPHVRIVSNTAGITGGIRLWEPELDELFGGVPDGAGARDERGSHEGPDRRRRHDRHDRHHRQRSHRAHDACSTPTARSCCCEEGRKTEALEISTHVGGGAVNAAVAMARLGLDVAALVKLGKDAAGRDGAGAA